MGEKVGTEKQHHGHCSGAVTGTLSRRHRATSPTRAGSALQWLWLGHFALGSCAALDRRYMVSNASCSTPSRRGVFHLSSLPSSAALAWVKWDSSVIPGNSASNVSAAFYIPQRPAFAPDYADRSQQVRFHPRGRARRGQWTRLAPRQLQNRHGARRRSRHMTRLF